MGDGGGALEGVDVTISSCRFCGTDLRVSFCDLGMSPLSNAYLDAAALRRPEPFYPLHAHVCEQCFLVQLPAALSPEKIFDDYPYFSSYSDTWVAHAKLYADEMQRRWGLSATSQVVEIASNDGYLLQFFKAQGIPVLGIEPAANIAAAAEKIGIPTRVQFFGADVARQVVAEGIVADLLLGNNVLAHVPLLNDFVDGLAIALAPHGVLTMEFPHVLQLLRQVQYDTIYHEHLSYLSFAVVKRIFAAHGFRLFDVEELSTHGGSLRIFGCHASDETKAETPRVAELERKEREAGLTDLETYASFAERVRRSKRDLLAFLIEAKRAGKTVIGYGAPAKGNTLLNYCGIRRDFVDYVVDRSPHKQDHFLPGTHIPIYAPERLRGSRPDYLLILPWNLREEIIEQLAYIREWGGKFVIPIPNVEIIE